ncbi:MAG: transcriptional regulator NrdR [bacterium]
MRCPYCQFEDSKVIDSRSISEGRGVRRRRECLKCERRFTTKEYIEESPLMVVKSDGRRQPYDHEKLKLSLQIACKKRPISTALLEEVVNQIEGLLRDKQQDEVKSREIGELVIQFLRELDDVAYVRFASVYRNFQDKNEFLNELEELEK